MPPSKKLYPTREADQTLAVGAKSSLGRMITSARRRDHITPILRQLHWLPVRQRVDFKIAVLVFQCLTSHAPAYLADDCQLAADASARRLRSADTAKCVVRQ